MHKNALLYINSCKRSDVGKIIKKIQAKPFAIREKGDLCDIVFILNASKIEKVKKKLSKIDGINVNVEDYSTLKILLLTTNSGFKPYVQQKKNKPGKKPSNNTENTTTDSQEYKITLDTNEIYRAHFSVHRTRNGDYINEYFSVYGDGIYHTKYFQGKDGIERLIEKHIIAKVKFDVVNIYEKNNVYYYEVNVNNTNIIGDINTIYNTITQMGAFIIDKPKFQKALPLLLSSSHSKVQPKKLPPNIGLYLDENNYQLAFPHNTMIVPTNDQEKEVLKNLQMYKVDKNFTVLSNVCKIIDEHVWDDPQLTVVVGWLGVAPFLYTTPYFSTRPDLVMFGTHGTGKTFTIMNIVVPFYGSKIESGETFSSKSRVGDILSASSLPSVVEEVENITDDKDVFSLLKARTVGGVDFTRKTTQQTQIRKVLRTPLVIATNNISFITLDKAYTLGRTVTIFLQKDANDLRKLKKLTTRIMNERRIFGPLYLEEVISKYGTPIKVADKVSKYEAEILSIFAEESFTPTDSRRAEIYAQIYFGLLNFLKFTKNHRVKLKRLKKFSSIEKFVFDVVIPIEEYMQEIKFSHKPTLHTYIREGVMNVVSK